MKFWPNPLKLLVFFRVYLINLVVSVFSSFQPLKFANTAENWNLLVATEKTTKVVVILVASTIFRLQKLNQHKDILMFKHEFFAYLFPS